VLALAGVGVACAPTKPPPPPPPTQHCVSSTPDTAAEYQSAFDGLRNAGTGWLASDGSLPVPLPDGRILWLFGDTIRSGAPLVNNSFVVQDDNCFRPVFEPLADPAGDQWLWPTAGVVEGSMLRVFALHMVHVDQPVFPFAYVRMVVASFSLPNLTPIGGLVQVPGSVGTQPSYGQTVVVANDGGTDYVYAYGKTSTGTGLSTVVNHHLARVPLGQVLTGTWEVWDGNADPSEWSSDPGDRAPLTFSDPDSDPAGPDDGPKAPLAVSSVTGGFLGSALEWDVLSDQLETWDAPAPQGPFTFRALAVDIWPGSPPAGEFGYGGRVVLDLPGAPIALWSINNEDFNAVLANLSLYKARFETPAAASVP
jgi:hypothetical protein